jgi:hypothetical protein
MVFVHRESGTASTVSIPTAIVYNIASTIEAEHFSIDS